MLMFKMSLRFLKKKKTESGVSICLSDTLFLAHTLSPEGKILAVHASGSTVSPCRYTCSRLRPDRSFILLPIDRLMRPCSCSQKMRGHIYPSTRRGSNRSIVVSSSLPTAACSRAGDDYFRWQFLVCMQYT